MKSFIWKLTVPVIAALFAGGAVLFMPSDASADKPDDEAYHADYMFGAPADETEAWVFARAGRLYDKWFAVLEMDKPKETHPLWPAANTKKKGNVTWRCKSCHGWDFKGAAGKYASGSYKTGIKGVSGVKGKDPAAIAAIINNDMHAFKGKYALPKDDVMRLASFLSKGQYDITKYVSNDGTVNGNVNRGRSMYQNTCAACHGFDGRALNWGSEKKPAYIGTEANSNPWEIMAKIRHGHPATEMIAYTAFPMQFSADVLAYTKTLPVK